MTTYDRGDLVRLTGTFRDAAGALQDPTTVTLKYQTPSGATTTLVYLTDAALNKSSTGIYYADISLTEDGIWTYRYESTGTGQAAGEGQLFAKSAL